MTNSVPAPDAEVLGRKTCWQLLRGVSVGRLALWVLDHPDIFPVNYAVDQESLVFRTGPGTKLDAVLGGFPVALEADGVDPATGVAWSVVVKGKALAVRPGQELLESVTLRLFPWHGGPKEHFIRIVPDSVTGRRFVVVSPRVWWQPLNEGAGAE
ncbi:pyridoxamine 5'-phosphate oxidase family protein [Arthrobacter sp. I2-34]|uniref:Pyridoxamine 5'-phosphate oxidase family protein n=1 Tax=Arthrobacter hankyongi TaxID=2904801 RepID=A0ABS9L666_9MICC|nr:pyridoxamine 5'-phosphate oxidase family protein [Arthrobacter hankyongi]MCG2622172.1 pyridoxamine 5'-phosphate oxidase family protein [Arthrobacter hankyongi]